MHFPPSNPSTLFVRWLVHANAQPSACMCWFSLKGQGDMQWQCMSPSLTRKIMHPPGPQSLAFNLQDEQGIAELDGRLITSGRLVIRPVRDINRARAAFRRLRRTVHLIDAQPVRALTASKATVWLAPAAPSLVAVVATSSFCMPGRAAFFCGGGPWKTCRAEWLAWWGGTRKTR
jgi:hypothetical protein